MNRLSSLESTFENGFNQNSGCCIGRMARNMRCFPVDCRIHLFVRNLSIANRFIFELYRFGTIGLLSSTITKACRQGAIIVAFKTMRIVKLNRKESKANQPRWLLNHFTSKECPAQMKLNQTMTQKFQVWDRQYSEQTISCRRPHEMEPPHPGWQKRFGGSWVPNLTSIVGEDAAG